MAERVSVPDRPDRFEDREQAAVILGQLPERPRQARLHFVRAAGMPVRMIPPREDPEGAAQFNRVELGSQIGAEGDQLTQGALFAGRQTSRGSQRLGRR
jgi:hypothetical protein